MKLKIAYGLMGYGRGHAMRTSAVLPSLMQHYDVRIYAGGDSYESLKTDFPIRKIPTIAWQYNANGKISTKNTLQHNVAPMADLLFRGRTRQQLEAEWQQWRPDVVISDSEAWTHRCAERLRIPRISFDHVGIIAWCLPPLPREEWGRGHRDALGYRMLMGNPDRILISSFYTALPARQGVEFVGPMLREVITEQQPSYGNYVLAYFNKGEHQYLPHVERALQNLPHPVVVYGAKRVGLHGNILYKPPGTESFAKDLAGCRALVSTSGNQLLSEAIHYRKPVLTLPEDVFEQRLNAFMVRRIGVGQQANLLSLRSEDIESLIENEQLYRRNAARQLSNGRERAIELLHQYINELTHAELSNPTVHAARRNAA